MYLEVPRTPYFADVVGIPTYNECLEVYNSHPVLAPRLADVAPLPRHPPKQRLSVRLSAGR